jgi:hypothetical protein
MGGSLKGRTLANLRHLNGKERGPTGDGTSTGNMGPLSGFAWGPMEGKQRAPRIMTERQEMEKEESPAGTSFP